MMPLLPPNSLTFPHRLVQPNHYTGCRAIDCELTLSRILAHITDLGHPSVDTPIERRKSPALLVRSNLALPLLHARNASEGVSAAVKVESTRSRFVLVWLSLVAPFKGLSQAACFAGGH